jgi:hypothetical protein
MNFELIGHLIRLRYLLMWASMRKRNGRIAAFMVGYMLLLMVGMAAAAGGIGAGMVAVRSGKAEFLAQGILLGLFMWATVTSVMLGFGMNAVFSDLELRRYALNARERRFARHFTGLADPFWFLFMALELGLAVGLYLFGVSNLALGILAVFLLYICNYLAAQVICLVMEWLLSKKGGAIVLPLIFVAFCVLPGVVMPMLAKKAGAKEALLRLAGLTPGFAAGSLMTRTDAAALGGFGLLALWIAGLLAALMLLERLPRTMKTAENVKITWGSPFDRVGAYFGPEYAPLVTHWLQFYFRCRRFRLSYIMSLPLIPFLLLLWTKQGTKDPNQAFSAALGVFAIAGLAPTAAFLVNQFGYVGSGFRRYFLFPGSATQALRASSYTLLALCAVLLCFATLAWVIWPAAPYDARGLAMLVASGVTGLFLFHGVGLWTSIYGARRSDPNKTMGNDLSLAGNIVVVGGMMFMLIVPRMVGLIWKHAITPAYWYIPVALAFFAAAFYAFSLRGASVALLARREQLLAIVEGKA